MGAGAAGYGMSQGETGEPMIKRAGGGSTPFHLRGYNESIGAPTSGSEPGVRRFTTPHVGMIHSPIPGRTDKISMNVKGGSYILPADIVSGIGQGNSMAGASILNKFFKMSPYGASAGRVGTPKVNYGKPMNMRLPSMKAPKFAGGGQAETGPGMLPGMSPEDRNATATAQMPPMLTNPPPINQEAADDMPLSRNVEDHRGDIVPIVAAGGEFAIPPHVVELLGSGSMKKGHEILDNLVLHMRKKNIEDQRKLKGPKR
jgi:hypothetical protein